MDSRPSHAGQMRSQYNVHNAGAGIVSPYQYHIYGQQCLGYCKNQNLIVVKPVLHPFHDSSPVFIMML